MAAFSAVETRARARTRRSPGPRFDRGCGRTAPGRHRCSGPSGGQHRDAQVGRRVQLAAAVDLEPHQLDERRRRLAGQSRSTPNRRRSSCGTYCRPRSRSSSMSRRKFVSWNALPRSRRVRGGLGMQRLEDRQHHLADHRRRAVHVDEQVVPGLVRGDGEVHRHRSQEPAEAVGVDVERAHGVHDGLQHRIVRRAAVEVGEEPVAEVGQRRGPLPRPAPGRGRRRCRRRSGRTRTARARGGASPSAAPSCSSSTSCRSACSAARQRRSSPRA